MPIDVDQDRTFSSAEVTELAGVTYRQLDYWARNDVLSADVRGSGSGTHRRWPVRQVQTVRVLAAAARFGAGCDTLARIAAFLVDVPLGDFDALVVFVDERGNVSATLRPDATAALLLDVGAATSGSLQPREAMSSGRTRF